MHEIITAYKENLSLNRDTKTKKYHKNILNLWIWKKQIRNKGSNLDILWKFIYVWKSLGIKDS